MNDKELVSEIKNTVNNLNDVLHRACEAGISVQLNVSDITSIKDSVKRAKIGVRMCKYFD